ncbi:MAG: hypothetical protein RBR41_02290 [Desulfovibrio sp.]|uniref:hypothetical protein n=1 Tax=Desulfovibrio sp. TaxID=885 RepID=UPI002A371C4E|nr:hypothetical protein [Desulfovibrio sp.]MDY0258480.1 hypothetical protein [Desulfovibrio sp.]
MNGFQFERALVELISEISLKKGIKAKPLAEKAWTQRKDAGTKWRKIRNGDPPQELSVRDAYDLACAMGVSITDLCGAVQSKALETTFECAKNVASEKKMQIPHSAEIGSEENGSAYKN